MPDSTINANRTGDNVDCFTQLHKQSVKEGTEVEWISENCDQKRLARKNLPGESSIEFKSLKRPFAADQVNNPQILRKILCAVAIPRPEHY
jgi:hypothetical protein